MRVINVSCNQCGAPLQVSAKTRFLTCGFCSSRLEVHREGDAIYSEVLESIDQKTNQIAVGIEAIRAQNDLARLDRGWLATQMQYQVRGRIGELNVPTITGAVIGMTFVIVFGILWIVVGGFIGMALTAVVGVNLTFVFPVFGLLFIVVGVASCVNSHNTARQLQIIKDNYKGRRIQTLNQLHERRSSQ